MFVIQRSIIVKVEYDHGTHCCMSPDGKGYILTQENNQTVNVYKIAKKDDGKLTGQFTMQFAEVCVCVCVCVCVDHVCMYISCQELMSRQRQRRSMKLKFHDNPNYITEFEINLIRHAQVM